VLAKLTGHCASVPVTVLYGFDSFFKEHASAGLSDLLSVLWDIGNDEGSTCIRGKLPIYYIHGGQIM
jgi:hypothetical protein